MVVDFVIIVYFCLHYISFNQVTVNDELNGFHASTHTRYLDNIKQLSEADAISPRRHQYVTDR